MSTFQAFRFDGKRVLVVGGATGMGAAAAQLAVDAGAEVIVADFAEITQSGVQTVHVNLAETASIDALVGELGAPIDALLSCAGVADGTPNIEKVNFLGHRYLIDKLVDGGLLGRGSSIGFISSAAGLGWEANLELLNGLLDTPDFEGGAEWFAQNGKADYYHTKQAVCAYVAREAFTFMKQGIRINAICPGPTETPLAKANADTWLAFGEDYRQELGIEASTPLEQAYPLLFLVSDAAVAISGITLVTDVGYMSSGLTESFPPATFLAKLLNGRPVEM
ncbi:MAG TPA: SDR family oxidoreductase [Microthrixaceae bacterium]|nr:SDR family oxidoreductase [Microthrixaceae bacterium]